MFKDALSLLSSRSGQVGAHAVLNVHVNVHKMYSAAEMRIKIGHRCQVGQYVSLPKPCMGFARKESDWKYPIAN